MSCLRYSTTEFHGHPSASRTPMAKETLTQSSRSEPSAHFGPALFEFLAELKQNNRREWFVENKERYQRNVLQPMVGFVAALGARLPEISSRFEADARPVGGSIFRIHRDTRFSRDKSPYKTAVAAHFKHSGGGDVHAPGFYLHLEPGDCLGGGGIWHPDGAALAKIRGRIDEKPRAWSAAVSGITLEGDSLKRPPAGYRADHPHIADLKRKDFYVMTRFTEAEACAPDFLEGYLSACRRALPLNRFLCTALDLPF
jgi:uncharacterized protein (TIGR02453 family)